MHLFQPVSLWQSPLLDAPFAERLGSGLCCLSRPHLFDDLLHTSFDRRFTPEKFFGQVFVARAVGNRGQLFVKRFVDQFLEGRNQIARVLLEVVSHRFQVCSRLDQFDNIH